MYYKGTIYVTITTPSLSSHHFSCLFFVSVIQHNIPRSPTIYRMYAIAIHLFVLFGSLSVGVILDVSFGYLVGFGTSGLRICGIPTNERCNGHSSDGHDSQYSGYRKVKILSIS